MPHPPLPPFQPPPIVQTLSPEEKALFRTVLASTLSSNSDSGLPQGGILEDCRVSPLMQTLGPETATFEAFLPGSAALLGPPVSVSASSGLTDQPDGAADLNNVKDNCGSEELLSLGADQQVASAVRQVLSDVGTILVSSGLTSPAILGSSSTAASPLAAPPGELLVVQNVPAPSRSPEAVLGEPIELKADRQEYSEQSQIFTASGNVLMRFRGGVLKADQLQVNLQSQVAIAQGNVTLTRGDQVLEGERLEYRFVQNQGSFLNARGIIYFPTAETDFLPTPPTDVSADAQAFTEQIQNNQPLAPRATESIQRLRFQAERIEFNAQGWQARAIRITNDPFSPPELEVRAERAELTRSPFEDKVTATRPRLVLDQGLSLPILRSQVTIDRQERNPTSVPRIGFDENDRGGIFIGQDFEFDTGGKTDVSITPQFFLQRAFEDDFNVVDPDVYGLNVRLRSELGPGSLLTGFTSLTSLDLSEISDNLRARLSLRQTVGTHTLTLESSYRDRLFNGSLGEQTVESNVGAVFSSPLVALGNTGINLNYQVGAQYVTANSDRPDIGGSASLGRFQASADLSRGFYLWQGKALPATETGGLKYTSIPVVPYLQLLAGVTGVLNAYTNGDTQQTLIGTVGLQGQLGHFSRRFLDYTGFNISYSQVGQNGLSPFLFDRVTDFKVLSAGVLQQVYGPLRLGVQTSLNLDTGEQFDTDIILNYSRRTYGLTFRYSPSREVASVDFRLNGFNWSGNPEPFPEPEIRSVEGGVRQADE